MNPVEYHKGRMEWHRERADAHAEPMDHLHYLHTDAANKHEKAMKLHQSGNFGAGASSEEAAAASKKTVGALEHVGKGTPDKSPWTIYSHAFDEKKKDVGKGFKSSLTKEGKLRSSAVIKEMHHPRTATQTREAIDHLSDHSDTHTSKEQAVLEERVRRAAKKHGVSMAGKSPKAARRLLERKARMAKKALEAIKAMSSQDIEAQREKVIGPAGRYPGYKFSDGNQQMIDKFADLLRTAKALQNPTQLAEGHDKQSAGHFAAAQSLQQTAQKTPQSPGSPVPNLIAGHMAAGGLHKEAAAAHRSGAGDPNAATRSANISSFKVGGMAKPAVSTGAKSPVGPAGLRGIGGSPGSSGSSGALHSGPATSAVSSAAPTGEHMQMKALEAIKAMVNPEEHAATALVDHHYYTKLGKQDLAKEARVDYDKAKAKGVKVTPEHIDSIHKFAKEQSSKMPKNPAIDKMSDEAHEAARKEVGMNKAMTASSMPRIPRALMNDAYRSATAVLTRDHSAIAKDMHTGPLTDEVIQELRTEEANRTRRQPVYKSCDGCGRTFMVKSMDDPCPTCSMRKSHYCSKCNSHLVKGRSGTTCPLCG